MITLRYFASLKDTLGRSSERIKFAESQTVLNLWQLVNPDLPLSENILMAVNMDYVSRSHIVNDGDEVAFFPPVTGG